MRDIAPLIDIFCVEARAETQKRLSSTEMREVCDKMVQTVEMSIWSVGMEDGVDPRMSSFSFVPTSRTATATLLGHASNSRTTTIDKIIVAQSGKRREGAFEEFVVFMSTRSHRFVHFGNVVR